MLNFKGLLKSFIYFSKDIKLSHSIFALPFAASALFLIELKHISNFTMFLLLCCMVAARSYAMGMNRYLDREIDASNPRTKQRMIPSGKLNPQESFAWSIFWAAVLVYCAFRLNDLSGYLSFPLLIILGGYSLMKRISALTHLYLGICLGLSPIAVSISLTADLNMSVIVLGISIMFWTAGFDILYALQDREFDQSKKLKSIPALLTPIQSMMLSRMFFLFMAMGLFLIGYLSELGAPYFIGCGVICIFLFYQHWLVRDAKNNGQSKNINAAFFNTNAYISILYISTIIIDKVL